MSFFKAEDLPEGILLLRSIPPPPRGGLHPLGALTSPKGWAVGLIFSVCDPWDKRKDMGKKLTASQGNEAEPGWG